jgi:YVTN family beta-propeller protein
MRISIRLAIASLIFAAAFPEPRCLAASAATRLYVTNSLADDITVIDLKTFKVVQNIRVGAQVHGLCAQADGRRLFTTIESEHNLKTIDTATGRILSVIPVTGRPNECAATPDGRFVGVPIRDGNSVDIVDTTLRKVVKVLPVKVPHNCFNAGSNVDMYVSSMGSDDIERIDLKTMEYSEKIPVGGIPRPYAVSNDEKTVYVALSDFHGFAIASIPACKVVGRVELPSAPPSECPLEPHTPTHGLGLSPDGKQLWVTSLADARVYVYHVDTRQLLGKVLTGKCPNWIAFSPDGRYCCVSNSGSDDCSIIDTQTQREVARVNVGKGPKRLLAVTVPGA